MRFDSQRYSYEDKANDMYERAIDDAYGKIEASKTYLEQLSNMIESTNIDEDAWRDMDSIISKVLLELDSI